MTWRRTWWFAAILAAVFAGCSEDIPKEELVRLKDLVPKPKEEEKKAPENIFGTAPTESNGDAASTGYGGTTAPDNTFGHGAPILLKSEVGNAEIVQADGTVGKRGQGYGGGLITEPLSQYFQIQSRIEFLNMKNTLKNYRPLHNDKNPATREEFNQEILQASGVTLPELPPGHAYVYDPEAKDLDAVLSVARPQPQQP